MDLFDRILSLSQYGYFCSQILAILLLETTGEENTDFVKAMGGLDGGVGYSGGCCGCMTAGACMISYFTGKGEHSGYSHTRHRHLLGEFTDWFTDEMWSTYGGINCKDIIKETPARRLECCPQIIAATYEKCMELLSDGGLLDDI